MITKLWPLRILSNLIFCALSSDMTLEICNCKDTMLIKYNLSSDCALLKVKFHLQVATNANGWWLNTWIQYFLHQKHHVHFIFISKFLGQLNYKNTEQDPVFTNYNHYLFTIADLHCPITTQKHKKQSQNNIHNVLNFVINSILLILLNRNFN